MNEALLIGAILLVLIILAAMWHFAHRERDPHGIDAYAAEVTSSNPAAILAQIAGTPLNEVLFNRCAEETPLYPRVRSATMRQILISAGSLDREELTQAAIRLGNNREIAEAYADEIISLADPGSDRDWETTLR